MKEPIKYLSLLAILFLVISCGGKKTTDLLQVDLAATKLLFAQDADTKEIALKSNADFNAILSDASWCNAEIWTKDDEKKIIVTVKPNSGQNKRDTSLSLKTSDGSEAASITITQLGLKPDVIVEEDSLLIADKLSFSLNLIANLPVEILLPDWIKPGKEAHSFIACKLPADLDSREGHIFIKGLIDEHDLSITIPVVQKKGQIRFAVISDIMIGRISSQEKLITRLSSLLSSARTIDAVFLVGDLTDRGSATQYQELKTICDSIIPPDVPVYYMMGNSDHYMTNGEVIFKEELRQDFLHHYFYIREYPFVMMSMKGIYTDRFTKEDTDFLFNSLADANTKSPGKPIFFFTHIGLSDTYYGTEKEKGNFGSEIFRPALERFPQVIAFSGHSNYSIADPRSIHQDKFTSVSIGSGSPGTKIEYGYTEGTAPPNFESVLEGLIVTVSDNGDVEIERWDTYRNEEIAPRWLVKAPHNEASFTYKTQRETEAPSFYEPDKAVFGQKDGAYWVTFPQAKDNESVHHYIIEVVNGEEVVFRNTLSSQFYLGSAKPQTITARLFRLPSEQTLFARIKAVDAFANISKPLDSDTFSLRPFIPKEGIVIPEADLFDISFREDGKAIDLSPNKLKVETGEVVPETYFDKDFGRYISRFHHNKKAFYKLDYTDNDKIKSALASQFSIEVMYSSNDLLNASPLSGKEWEGLGIEQEGGGQIEFWAYIDDKYKKAKSSAYIVPGEYYHVVGVYNKEKNKLCVFVNGRKAGAVEVSGELLIPRQADSQWFCIGGDTHPSGNIQQSLSGDVVVSRMYSRSLSEDEVYLLYEELKRKK